MIELPKMTFCKILPDLPKPSKLRRQSRKDGGYDMVPAYTDEEMFKYGEVCAAEAREQMREECIAAVKKCKDKSGVNDDGRSWLERASRGDYINAIKELP